MPDKYALPLLGAVVGLVITLAIYALLLALSCTSSSTPRRGVSVDPCDACHASCNDADGQIQAWQCEEECTAFCGMLRDGGP